MNAPDAALAEFIDLLATRLADGRLERATLAKYHGPETDLQQVLLRRVDLRGQPHLQLVFRHATRDITKNHPLADAPAVLRGLLGAACFRRGHLHATDLAAELAISQRGQARLHRAAASTDRADAALPATPPAPALAAAHNRQKHRYLDLERPFLAELGVTTADHRLIPAMARKWKQINKFVEVFAHALADSAQADAAQLRVVDFGSGKGYLTFAVHDWLRHARGIVPDVVGVELRADMVQLCNAAIERLGLAGLRFEQGDIAGWRARPIDVVIALHACDTATDLAIDLGIRARADIILCAPCCHKQIRPQLLQPHPLRPILQHGVHLGQEAEMLTDGLRALLLESRGYDTKVFEFVSLEHTSKNKMILAVRRRQPKPADTVLAQIAEIKAFYGIREHCLEALLNAHPDKLMA